MRNHSIAMSTVIRIARLPRRSVCLFLLGMTPAWLGVTRPLAVASAVPEPPATRPALRVDVREQGAAGDGKAKDTAAFQRALDACGAAGGGEVVVPAGRYVVGSLKIPSGVTLRVLKDATVAGSDDLADYPLATARWEGATKPAYRALLWAEGAQRVAVVGEGT